MMVCSNMSSVELARIILTMLLRLLLLSLSLPCRTASATNGSFLFNGFRDSNLILHDSAVVTKTGALRLTNGTRTSHVTLKGQAIYPTPLQFKDANSGRKIISFSTRFVFEIISDFNESGGHGFAFFVSSSTNFSDATGGQTLGLFKQTGNGSSSNSILAVEFDTVQVASMSDIDADHVGVDLNSIFSVISKHAAYYTDEGKYESIVLDSKMAFQAWIDYDGYVKLLNVSIAPLTHPLKPNLSLISYNVDLSTLFNQFMYVGFSSGTQKLASEHYILAWSFRINGEAPALDLANLPPVPVNSPKNDSKFFMDTSIALTGLLLSVIIVSICYVSYRRRKLTSEKVEGWESAYPHRFPYKELYRATKGFKEKKFLGKGGFGKVYKGVLAKNGVDVAVKRVSHGTKQGMREFAAEVSSLGRLRHKNLVQLRGWCRRGEELLLVYDFMQNGSLDSFLFEEGKRVLSWEERFKILKGIAYGLLYLHEECEEVVVHRDIKASNVLLDSDMTGRLSDFGLARLYEHGSNPKTTHVVGTLGYMAPELTRTWKATASSDVFSYGALLLEVACGRRPIEPEASGEGVVLVELVHLLWKDGQILNVVDKRLGVNYVRDEAEMVLKLGLLCSQVAPEARPSNRQVVQFLDGDASLQDLELELHNLVIEGNLGVEQIVLQYPSFENQSSSSSSWLGCTELSKPI